MPDEPVLDLEAIKALRELSPDADGAFLRELIEIFLQDTPNRLAEIDTSLGKNDAPTLTRAAHSIKGSSSNFGARRLAKTAHEMELLGKAGDLSAAAAMGGRLKSEYALVAQALTQIAQGK